MPFKWHLAPITGEEGGMQRSEQAQAQAQLPHHTPPKV